MGDIVLYGLMGKWQGYPWTVIPVERRDDHMQALEQVSVHQNIAPFTAFLAGLVEEALAK